MKYIISGGAGFIGSALCNRIVKDGHYVVAFDNFSRKSHQSSLDSGVIEFNGDVRDIGWLHDAIEAHGPFDAIWHLAYINGTKTFYSNPELVLDVGVKGAINTIDAALEHGINNYVLVSTSEVYNEPTQVPTPETERMLIPDVYNPRFSYSGGKIISELLAIHYGTRKGLNTKIFRPHNIYGPNMGFEHVIPEIVGKILFPKEYDGDRPIVNIQGCGQETRSFCYIDDAIDQMVFLGSKIEEGCSTYNIGVENEITIDSLVVMIAGALDMDIVIRPGKKQAGSSDRRCPSLEKTRSIGYIPKSDLRAGIEKTVKWYKERLNG